MDNSGVGADGTVQFANTLGLICLDVIDITGNLNLDAAILIPLHYRYLELLTLVRCNNIINPNVYKCVTLSGGDRILTGTIINFGSTLAGGQCINITGNLDLDGAATDLSTLSYLEHQILERMLPPHLHKPIPVQLHYQELTEP